MLTYLIILLDDSSVSYCNHTHSSPQAKEGRGTLMPLEVLRKGIVWAMKENVNIQFVYPSFPLPEEYRTVIETIDHSKIGPIGCGEKLDVVVVEDLHEIWTGSVADHIPTSYVWHATLAKLERHTNGILTTLRNVARLNVMTSGTEAWGQEEFDRYKAVLETLADGIVNLYNQRQSPQLNLLTDRLTHNGMNNCGAGDSSLTLAPDGCLYVCPAFYNECLKDRLAQGQADGMERGLPLHSDVEIPNRQLFQLDHAPLCRCCDAYQCRRCIWMNCKQTLDVNTPSHQQCVAAHIERNASRRLLSMLREQRLADGIREIKEIDYLDPLNKFEQWKLEKLWDK